MGRKALFFDIDGTLLSEVTGKVPGGAVQALEEARKRGHLVFINSGRTYCLIGPIRDLLSVDGYLCGCGTRVMAGEKVIYSASIPEEKGRKVKAALRRHNMEAVLEGTQACYFPKAKSRIPKVEMLREYIGQSGHVSPYSLEDEGYEFDKFCALADSQSDAPGFIRELGLDFDVIDRGGQFYECVPAGHSKATAIDIVLDQYGIPLKDAYVFGDSANDLPMFEHVPNAVLMGCHDKELEPYASFITKNVEADGIAYAMGKLGII